MRIRPDDTRQALTVDNDFVRGNTYYLSLPRHPHFSPGHTQTLVYREQIEVREGCPRCVFSIMLAGRMAGEFCIDPGRAHKLIYSQPQ
ncbi:MAG TPA: hypothetical protein PK027_04370 [Aquimonas sp.]|jgi:hypothetical protein|nr:hypothetical protein [Xanthomonadales bacterium]HRD73178.1 hypothetical protein [Aquimonas sp.]HRF53676.1 hypothetical protein [Aquimonas sp.]